MAARITEVRDGVAALLRAGWPTPAPATVHTTLPRVNADKIAGRHVWLYRAGQVDGGPADRERSITDFRVAVQVTERFPPADGEPTEAWIDGLLEWVSVEVWEKLGKFNEDSEPLLGSLWPETREWEQPFDPDLMTEHGVFEAVVTLTYREER